MDLEDIPQGPVDPEVRAYVSSLVSALGGTGADKHGRYVLGDDALACLKDLRKWLKLHDEKANRLDVARCLAEGNLVSGDLLEILAIWREEATEDRIKSKIALACLELLVPLTWPIEKNDLQMTVNHHRHVPYLQLAQVSYKRAILEHGSQNILRNAVRIGLPSMALQMGQRVTRDEGIIKLLLYFFRNVAMISPPTNLPVEGNGDKISRSATIEAFHQQDVLALLLTISSNMGEDFNTQDTVIMEILFHLLKGIDMEKLFMDKAQLDATNTDELRSLLATEAGMHRNYAKNAPTRHNRFGTMIWVKRDDARVSTVSGQDVLSSTQRTFSKMDESKKWNRPKQRSKDTEPGYDRFDLPVSLDDSATRHLRAFVEEFLDSSFNPLFTNIRKAIERESDRVLEIHAQQFFYLISWFLEAERVRRKKKTNTDMRKRSLDAFEAESFALIASVLNQETFVALNRFMQDRLDLKLWREVNAGTRCFTQILLIVQEIAESPLEEDQEIAENIQNRIFYEETTHDRIIALVRGYKDQGFGYLDSCTELSHVFFRMLERYSKENVDLQVRSRRRARVRRKAAAAETGNSNDIDDEVSEMEDVVEAERVSKERKFDFGRFSSKFMTQACINTFVSFTRYYNDLNTEQLKRAHRFFHRVAFKQELSVMLFRLDIIALFNRMIKGPEGLDTAGKMYKEWDELVRQLIKKMIKKLQQRPELAVEMLFSKVNSTVFYLENGYEKQTTSSRPRPPAMLEVRGAMTRDEQIGVAVAVLFDEKIDAVNWVAKVLSSAASERQSWEAETAARQLRTDPSQESSEEPQNSPAIIVSPDNEERRIAMFKDNKLRLLMTLAGFERLGIDDEPSTTWLIPSALSARDLSETQEIIERHRNNPTMEYGDEDPKTAEEMLRRAPTVRKRAEYDDDDSEDGGILSNDEEDFLFRAGGPTETNKKSAALARLKKKRRNRRTVASGDDVGDISDDTREAKRKARLEADQEKKRKMKSKLLVRDSDDESDEDLDREFFAREEAIRRGQAERVREALQAGRINAVVGTQKRISDTSERGNGKRARLDMTTSNAEDPDVVDEQSPLAPRERSASLSSDVDESPSTPFSSPPITLSQEKGPKVMVMNDARIDSSLEGIGTKASSLTLIDQETDTESEAGDEDENDMKVVPAGRRRARVTALLLDDSDED
ncbi:Topoisomerase 1-associated factor 1 [Sticta canariensis]|nr:Topoisomerase 1-associated factor 1 [Sticta canariensis]